MIVLQLVLKTSPFLMALHPNSCTVIVGQMDGLFLSSRRNGLVEQGSSRRVGKFLQSHIREILRPRTTCSRDTLGKFSQTSSSDMPS